MLEPHLRLSTLAIEGNLQISKLIKIPALLDRVEMESLFYHLNEQAGQFGIFQVYGVLEKKEAQLSQEMFLERYGRYIALLQEGQVPLASEFIPILSPVFSRCSQVLYGIPVKEEKIIVRASKPVVQLQSNQLRYSSQDGEFRQMVYGDGGIFWGVQWTYPHLFQDARTHEIKKVVSSDEFPNTLLFQALQKWVRANTLPTPFLIDGKRVNVPIRLGKKCFSWINNHPQLIEQNIKVHTNEA